MFEIALKAGLPIIGVRTDDQVNLTPVLKHYSGGRPVMPLSPTAVKNPQHVLYYAYEADKVDAELYRKFMEHEVQLVIINVDEPSQFIFDAGLLPTPVEMIEEWLVEFELPPARAEGIIRALKGLSLKTSGEIVALATAASGELTERSVRDMRATVFGVTPGMSPVDTSLEFYDPPQELQEWLALNAKHFTADTKPKLVPRGLLLDGPPGVGKTAASKYVASRLGLPLYRLDIPNMLDKYVGQSEKAVARAFQLVERESPCVVLIDEVEKLFTEASDTGVTQRILSQFLWWLAEHRSRVFTVMTTNEWSKIVPELYRPGRVDKVIRVERLNKLQARTFAAGVYKGVLGKPAGLPQVKVINEMIDVMADKSNGMSHAWVQQEVIDLIKRQGWV